MLVDKVAAVVDFVVDDHVNVLEKGLVTNVGWDMERQRMGCGEMGAYVEVLLR